MKNILTTLAAISFLYACNTTKRTSGDDGRIDINIVQINDVYEIAPLENGKSGGMARVTMAGLDGIGRVSICWPK